MPLVPMTWRVEPPVGFHWGRAILVRLYGPIRDTMPSNRNTVCFAFKRDSAASKSLSWYAREVVVAVPSYRTRNVFPLVENGTQTAEKKNKNAFFFLFGGQQ